ncbi:MAG: CDP-diacylglycerol--serine O-phosphatidyltransferase [Acidobacteria bacterium]|nr:CDP-diacylglycerol--serine O-phosphatidyltransferase [Acidobacteriota bacterium]MCZ6746452.1 CDP-diacylglycerol--serine O-phosphatidyltransferase [Acidobacteriota bacterium]
MSRNALPRYGILGRHKRPMGARARRGIFILPSLLTVGNVLAGYAAIIAAQQNEFARAALLLGVAAVLDNLDGRVARATGTTSSFGVQFDSLADVLSFGVAPAFLVFRWGMESLGRWGWVASFLFLICGAMRLARFNIQPAGGDKRFFIGLPIPAAAMVVGAIIFYHPQPIVEPGLAVSVLVLVLLLSGLMVSRLRYRSFKSLDARGKRRSFLIVGLLALLLAAVVAEPQVALLSLSLLYMLSGLIPRRRRSRHSGAPATAAQDGAALADAGTGPQAHSARDGHEI